MTLQEIFDRVAKHLLTQKTRAYTPDGKGCMYRAPDGKRCAVGVLIPDELYDKSFEGNIVFLIPLEVRRSMGLSDYETTNFVFALQDIHDRSDPRDWMQRLRDLAVVTGLSTAVVDEMEKKS